MGVLHLFSIKSVFYDKMDLRLFSFSCDEQGIEVEHWREMVKCQ